MTPANAIALFALPMKATGVPITLVERANYVRSAKRGAPPPLWEKASTQTNRACAIQAIVVFSNQPKGTINA